ncbi:MAG: hypothetical protein ACXV3F_12100 [Frankiaceae bacterium]
MTVLGRRSWVGEPQLLDPGPSALLDRAVVDELVKRPAQRARPVADVGGGGEHVGAGLPVGGEVSEQERAGGREFGAAARGFGHRPNGHWLSPLVSHPPVVIAPGPVTRSRGLLVAVEPAGGAGGCVGPLPSGGPLLGVRCDSAG